MKKLISVLIALLMLAALACTGAPAGEQQTEDDGVNWNSMSMDALYEMAKQELLDNPNSSVQVYSTTSDASSAIARFRKTYPEFEGHIEYISQDTDQIKGKIEQEYNSGNVNADVVIVKDSSGEIYNELVLDNILKIFYPEFVTKHISADLLAFGLPLYSTFNPWFYNTEYYPDGVPIESWWDIVEGYNVDTKSYVDANGNNTQKWRIYTKDVTNPSYAALWAQLIADGDLLAEQYEKQFGKPVEYTYTEFLDTTGFMYLPENNAGVELFWRFTQMNMTALPDGDAVVEAVDNSSLEGTKFYGPTLGLCSASKIDNVKMGMHIAWVTGLSPYTAQNAAACSYVAGGCDNPAGARLFIAYIMGGEDGYSGCYQYFDKLGHWSVRDDVVYEKAGIAYEDVGLKSPDFAGIYQNYPNIKQYWIKWTSIAGKAK